MKLVCLAHGLPEPSYVIDIFDGMELTNVFNGVVIIENCSSILNATYTCIAKNNLGQDERQLNIDFSSYLPGKSLFHKIQSSRKSGIK